MNSTELKGVEGGGLHAWLHREIKFNEIEMHATVNEVHSVARKASSRLG